MGSQPWRSEKVRRTHDEAAVFAKFLSEGLMAVSAPRFYWGGSYRRNAPTVGDLDVVFVTDDGTLNGVTLPDCFEVQKAGARIAQGDIVMPAGWNARYGEVIEDRMHADFWACSEKEVGAFLAFITGPKDFNVKMRAHALRRNLTLSQYGVFDGAGSQLDDGTERGVFDVLGFKWFDPVDRQQFAARRTALADQTKEVTGSKGDRYTLSAKGGQMRCTCRGFQYRSTCRHVIEWRKELGI